MRAAFAGSRHNALRRNLRKGLLALAAILLVLAWQADLFKAKTAPGETGEQGPRAEEGAVVKLTEKNIPRLRHLTGRLVARAPIDILARVPGEVRELTVEAGERVEAGELLVRLDGERLNAARDKAAAALAVAEAEMEGAARLKRRITTAAEARALPETEAINAQRTFESAEKRVEQARAALREAEVQLGDTRLRSPITGVVVDTFKEPGNWVPPGEPLLSLFDPRLLEIEVGVPEALASRLEPGLPITCFIESLDTPVTATVRTLVPRAEPASRTVLAKLAFEPPEGAFPGMYARVELKGRSQTILHIPREAVRRIRQLDFVSFVDSSGRVSPRWVRLGQTRGESVSVLAGLTPGDRILRRYGALEGSAKGPPPDHE